MDRFRMLEAFVRVAELQSFTRAAEDLNVPRATVTELVQALESRLACTLLHRTTRRVSLTPEGAAFYERATTILQDLADAEDDLGGARGTPRGRLRVDVPAAAGRHAIAPALPQFFARYPEIRLELGSSDRPVELLLEGVDCVIRGGDIHDENLVARRLCEYRVVTCAAPAYLERCGVPASPADLEGHRFVNFFSAKTGRLFDNEFVRDGEAIRVAGEWSVAANDSDTFVAATVAGLGLAQLPLTAYVRGLIDAGALRVVLGNWSVPPLPLFALWPRRRDRSARLHAFVDWVTELYAAQR
ncbi:LysR family transcriptional regulator [Betaproteobacteria bacterium PRO7]|jgi:LysR family transcriptional regulator for bpeEF and oprC|nr:LysR family transcriptional regulator [Betaproteobacteria bacterium PRO7]